MTVKDWLSPALLVAVLALLTWQAFRGPVPNPPTPGPPPVVKPEPPLIVKPDPPVLPSQPEASDSPLTRAVRDYLRGLPNTLASLADKVESGEIKDKATAVAFTKKNAAALAKALDDVFSGKVDGSGKITDPGGIAGPLREAAKALGAGRTRAAAAESETL